MKSDAELLTIAKKMRETARKMAAIRQNVRLDFGVRYQAATLADHAEELARRADAELTDKAR